MERTDSEILRRAYEAWAAAEDLRERRERCKRFTYGDQWGDRTIGGRVIDEKGADDGERMLSTGRTPLTNNLIRQLVKTIVGRYRTLRKEGKAYGDAQSRRNQLGELDSRMLEEFLISGMAVQRVVNERRMNGTGVWVDNVDPRLFFVNSFKDPRGWDIELVGMLHDMGLPELVSRYGHGNSQRTMYLEGVWGECMGNAGFASPLGAATGSAAGSEEFYMSRDAGKIRVAEVWTLDAERDGRGAYRYFWRCRIYAPDGRKIDSYASPYGGGGHPFVVKFYPLTDGEVHSFVEDLIENQKYINRLISLVDHIMASSAKGALLYPLPELPGGVSLQEIAQRWAHPDGVIPLREGRTLPQQVKASGTADGAYELLNLQMKLFENSTGVSDVLLGRNVSAAVGTDNYRARVEAATIALSDIFDSFGSFVEARDMQMRKFAIVQK